MTHDSKLNPYQNALEQLEQVQKYLKIDNKIFKKLTEHDRVIKGNLEIAMDDGSKKEFRAYRAQHNNALGPYKGGIRFHPGVNEDEVKALSMWMSWKSGIIGLPFGGGKGGVEVEPKALSEGELERLSREYMKMVGEHVGAWKDVPAPDVNTSGKQMAWMLDEYLEQIRNSKSEIRNVASPYAVITGKPVLLGGSLGREQATGLGGFYILERLAKVKGLKPEETRIAIQGLGNVGYWFGVFAERVGYKVVAISDSKGGVLVERGLSPKLTLECKKKSGSVSDCFCTEGGCDLKNGKKITNEELLELDVDVLVPAALENVITEKNVDDIKAKFIIEMANGPVTSGADRVLHEKGVVSVPDVLANAGGVTVSYFEWVQNNMGYYWDEVEVFAKLEKKMDKAFGEVMDVYQEKDVSMRMAAYIKGVGRIVEAMKLRGV